MSRLQPLPSDPSSASSSDPLLASACLDFLLIELVPLAQRLAEQLQARERVLREEYRRSQIFNKQTQTQVQQTSTEEKSTGGVGGSGGPGGDMQHTRNASTTTTTATATNTIGQEIMDEETRSAVFWRLDNLGYRVGQGLVERFSANRPRPTNPLDAIKFVCKDLWTLVFRKQIDNLKTNHRGVFVLTDARFQPLSRMSVDRRAGPKAGEQALSRAQPYLYFPCGVIRGALAGLGVEVSVEATSTEIPVATFQIKTKGAKS